MFRRLLRKLHVWGNLKARQYPFESPSYRPLSKVLSTSISIIRTHLDNSDDLVVREFIIGQYRGEAAVIYIDGAVDRETINDNILRPLMTTVTGSKDKVNPADRVEHAKTHLISVGEAKVTDRVMELVDAILAGDTILLISGVNKGLILSTRSWETRSVSEPDTAVVIRGPHDGFVESLRTNLSLIRRRLRDPKLKTQTICLGERTRTDVCLVYLEGLARTELVAEVRRRLQTVEIDGVLDSGYIEEFIEDAPFSLFTTVGNSERPDAVCAKLLEGRVAIFVEGTPVVLTVPYLFVEAFQSPEDYYSRPFYASVVRLIRFLSFGITVYAPAIYVALITHHHELIPTPLLLTVTAAREGSPFPAVVEALAMGLVFEALREAGIRLPRPIGQAVSIVGALVIGQEAVAAGLIGSPMVIVVAITAITSFVTVGHTDVAVPLRVAFSIVAGVLGAFGLALATLLALVHVNTLYSFGVPYLSPFAPLSISEQKDAIIRAPWWSMLYRPRLSEWPDPRRREFRLPPQSLGNRPEGNRLRKEGS